MHMDVRGLRHLAGLTQIQAAKRSGIERSRLSLIECGHSSLSSEEMEALTEVLRTAIRERVKLFEHVLGRAEE